MQINVSQLIREPIGATRDYKINEAIDTGDGQELLVRGQCCLLRTQRSILASCRLSTEVELSCSRCLNPFRHPLALNFEEEYLPTIDVTSGAPLPASEETGALTIDEHHILDLSEAIRQYTLLAAPMKPLCREDCAGLCQSCGHNLNLGRCGCPVETADPRWSELTKLQ